MKKIIISSLLLLPAVAAAQATIFHEIILEITILVQTTIPIVASLALLFFLYGIARFILAGGDEENIKNGKRFMFWSVITLFVMASLYGIITVMQNFFGYSGGSAVFDIPINPNP
jgi:hypothetical protein